MHRLYSSIPLLLILAGNACSKPAPEPERVFERFLADVEYGRADAAFAALSQGSKDALRAKHKALAPGATPKPADLLYGSFGLTLMSPPESVAAITPIGDEVLLRVTVKDGKTGTVRLVREGREWKVDLMGSLKTRVPPVATATTATTATTTPSSP